MMVTYSVLIRLLNYMSSDETLQILSAPRIVSYSILDAIFIRC